MSHPELPAEQAYVDGAYEALERMRAIVAHASATGDGEVAQAALEAWSARRLRTFSDAARGLVFGRLDFEQVEDPLYVGRRWVHDSDQQPLVVNWQAPAARPFYTATPIDPQRVTLRRRFRTDGRRLLDITDESLDGSTLDGAAVGDFLLEELGRTREAHMRDIVATIQGDQYRLITREPDAPLVIQGGPGTGKTAVGLHRASWLLYTFRERLERGGVLIVGPNRTFMEYVSHVLPALDENAVVQRALDELVAGVEPTLRDAPATARVKADARLAHVIARAAELRLEGEPEEVVLRLDGAVIRVRLREVAAILERVRTQHGATTAARERFRMELVRRFYAAYGETLGGAAYRDAEEIGRVLRAKGYLNGIVDRAWPNVSPEQLVRALLTRPAFLAEAADGILEPEEQKLLRRRVVGWSDADVPLLDEAHATIGTPPRRFGHVIVDEAQDLTPMQLRAISRRVRDGSLTILGDVAQATGAIPYRSWYDVLPSLPQGDEATVEELRHAYRVPREIMDFALPLLQLVAPGAAAPISYRTGAEPPLVRRVEAEHLLAEGYREAARLAADAGLIALIVPDELFEPALARGHLYDGIPLLTPRQAKGLEFDHVVVVEPALVAEHEQGLRELYVALTRPTKTLVVVHARALPDALRR